MKKPQGRRGLLAKVHIAKKQLAMNDAQYRNLLEDRYGVDSAGALSVAQLEDLVLHMGKVGWEQPQPKPKDGAPREPGMIAKVEALLAELGSVQGRRVSWNYARSILRRQCGVDRLEWATAEQLRGVVAALDKRIANMRRVSGHGRA